MKKKSVKFTVNRMFLKRREVAAGALVALSVAVLCQWVLISRLTAQISFNKEWLLATVGPKKITLQDLSIDQSKALAAKDAEREVLLRAATDKIVETTLFAQEAAKRSLSPDEFMKKVIEPQSPPSEAEILDIYINSPGAHRIPYEEALAAIRKTLHDQEVARVKDPLLKNLFKATVVKYFVFGQESAVAKPQAPEDLLTPYKLPVAAPDIENGKVVRAASKGPANAPILIEVFGDYMCPYSKIFVGTQNQLEKDYPSQIRFEFKHLPLPFHKGADLIAQATACAQEQGKFWQYHDALFALPKAPVTEDELVALAKTVGLDAELFGQRLKNGVYRPFVEASLKEAAERKARGTPTFFVNGNVFSGAMPPEMIKPVIEWCLKPQGPFPTPQRAAPKPPPAAPVAPPAAK